MRRTDPEESKPSVRTAAVAVLVVAAIGVSAIEGAPRALPGVALGSAVMLHAERSLAFVVIAIALLSVLVRAARGDLPVELSSSGLRYEAEAADATADAVDELQNQFDELVATVESIAARLDAPRREP